MQCMTQRNIVILISGGGSNMAAIVKTAQRDNWQQRYGARVAAVISNKADAGGLQFAREHKIATAVVEHKAYADRASFDAALQACIDQYQPALVVLAGFMRILTPEFVAHYQGRLLNIHPSLLPAFRGAHAIEQALEYGVKVFGVTIHYVDATLDGGKIISQRAFGYDGDDIAELEARIHAVEYPLYIETINKLLKE